jgi:hypothetical protein
VPGFGAKSWTEHYGSKRGKKPESAEVSYWKSQVEKFPEMLAQAAAAAAAAAVKEEREQNAALTAATINEQVNETIKNILPGYFDQYTNWRKGGKRGPQPVPTITSAGSDNQQQGLVTPAAPEGAPEIRVSDLLVRGPPAGTVQPGSDSATCAPLDGTVSSLEKLNKLKVTN